MIFTCKVLLAVRIELSCETKTKYLSTDYVLTAMIM